MRWGAVSLSLCDKRQKQTKCLYRFNTKQSLGQMQREERKSGSLWRRAANRGAAAGPTAHLLSRATGPTGILQRSKATPGWKLTERQETGRVNGRRSYGQQGTKSFHVPPPALHLAGLVLRSSGPGPRPRTDQPSSHQAPHTGARSSTTETSLPLAALVQ